MATPRMVVSAIGKRFRRHGSPRPQGLTPWQMLAGRRPVERFWALRDVSFEVNAGEMLGVIGRNGSGKSTLLRMLGEVMRPDEGHVRRQGRLRGLLELNTGMHGDLSGRENIVINGVLAGLTENAVRAKMDEIIDFSEIGQFIDDPFRTYSAGMKLRLGFAVSVHTEPEILLIDEVLSVGDLAFQQKCVDRIRQLKQSGCSIIVISHDLEQIGDLCDRALWLQGGRCRAYGEPQGLVERYQAAMHAETRQRAPSGAPVAYTAEGVALQHDVNRFGSLEATIEAVRVLDAAGNRTATLRTGEAATIEIDIRANSPVVGPHLSVAFGRDDETDCLDMNSGMDDVVFDEISGLQTASIRFSRLDLGKGKYRLSVGIHNRDWQYSFDYHWRAYSFDVVSDTTAPGVLVPPREWRIA